MNYPLGIKISFTFKDKQSSFIEYKYSSGEMGPHASERIYPILKIIVESIDKIVNVSFSITSKFGRRFICFP